MDKTRAEARGYMPAFTLRPGQLFSEETGYLSRRLRRLNGLGTKALIGILDSLCPQSVQSAQSAATHSLGG